jgi:hypothetical protein
MRSSPLRPLANDVAVAVGEARRPETAFAEEMTRRPRARPDSCPLRQRHRPSDDRTVTTARDTRSSRAVQVDFPERYLLNPRLTYAGRTLN